MLEYNIAKRINNITARGYSIPPPEREVILNNLNSQLSNILLGAERKCRYIRAGAIEYSPELFRLGLR